MIVMALVVMTMAQLKMSVEYFFLLLGQGVIKRANSCRMLSHFLFTRFHVIQHSIETIRGTQIFPVLMSGLIHFDRLHFVRKFSP